MNNKATLFEFTSYVFEPAKKRILFNYKTEFEDGSSLNFTETILLPRAPKLAVIKKEVVDMLLQSLHIILGISYYKFYCATKIALPYQLSKAEADFWNIIYKKGLGEFFYQNNLNPNISPKFPFQKERKLTAYFLPKNNRCLVGIGGGKDSIVVAELLKQYSFDITAFTVQTNKESELVKDVIGILKVEELKIKRQLDEKIHQKHAYDGHIPISAIYAFLGLAEAIFYGYSYVIVGNEFSSNFGNTTYKNLEINHQWSKSYEFETLMHQYVVNYISPDVVYFSLLRRFYEIRIVKLFSAYKKYFGYFSSCNNNFKIQDTKHQGLWCGQCAKCVFVFTLLSAFLSKKELLDIFGKNLYQNSSLLPLFKDVLGFGTMKPFDCVGTFQEAQIALYLAKKEFNGDYIVRQLGNRVKYYKEVFLTNNQTHIPEQFKFLGMETALIAGFGKEGKITQQYLKKYYPKLKIGIADAKEGRDYLKKQQDFDIAIKTPGIKKELITIPYTTATNIFFSKILGKNTIIGITGSKGKSTTSSLIYHILKTAGKDVEFLGNIGTPMLQALLHPIPKNKIFVLELSSYQLDDITYSPDIAVITNVFKEHLDFHGSFKNYSNAKRNIINFQNKSGFFVYNQKSKELAQWLKGYGGTAVPFVGNIPLQGGDIPLIGEHNKDNIKAAIAIANILHIKEELIKKAIKSFKPLPHRLEFVGKFKEITFINDANAAIPEATIMAIKSLKNIDTIFLGGQDRGYDFRQLEKVIKKYNIKNIVLFPDSGSSILTSTKGFNVLKTKSMKEAVKFAYQYTKKGSICLLSCASPSYSLWKNFEEKGDQFKKFTKELSNN